MIASSDLNELILLCDRISIVVDGVKATLARSESAMWRDCINSSKRNRDKRHDGGVAPQQAETAASRAPGASALMKTLLRSEWPWMLYLAFAVLLVVFSLASPWFLSVDNFLNIGRQTTLVSIVAVGMTFVIIAGQIDLSVASTLALSGMAAALAMAHARTTGLWVRSRA